MPTPSSSEKLRRQNLNLKRYLEELAALAGRSVQASELGSVEQALSIREGGVKFVEMATASSEIPFADLSSERFKSFVKRLNEVNPSPVYVWTPRTTDCGAFLLPSISAIRFDFDFTVNSEGILVFITNDFRDRLLLDYFILPTGEQRLKIETQGENWGGMGFPR
jgi:hypothetical protein